MKVNHIVKQFNVIANKYIAIYPMSIFTIMLLYTVPIIANAQEYLQIDQQSTAYSLADSLSVYVDEQHKLTPDNVLSGGADQLFKRSDTADLIYGFNESAIWIRFALENTSNQAVDLMFQIDYALLYHVHFFYQQSNGSTQSIITGIDYPYHTRPVDNGFFVFPIQLAPHQKQIYYLNVKSDTTFVLPLKLNVPMIYQSDFLLRYILLGAYFGLIISMFFYNLFLYFSIRDSAYLYYIFFLFTTGVISVQFYGIGYRFWPNAVFFNERLHIISLGLMLLSSLLFSRSFLHIKTDAPYFDKALKIIIYFTLTIVFLSLFLGYKILSNYMFHFSGIVTIIIAVMITIRLKQRYKPARFFAIAWFVLLIVGQITVLFFLNLLDYHPLFLYIYQVGHSLEAVLLSFALADRINILKQEKFESEQAADEAIKVAEAKSNFLAKMSHEIRTPMNGVLGMAELLKSAKLEPLYKHYVDVIHGSGKALLSVINDVLDHAKIEAGKMHLEKIPFNLDELVHDSVSVFTVIARDKGLNLLADVRPSMPLGLIGDPTRLRQILLNLLSNAFKFTSHGEISVRVLLDKKLNENDIQCRFEVQDTGVGIALENQTGLFQPFEQSDSSIARQYGGTGLGLTIARQLVELMDGEIGVDSIEGEGSIFWFTACFKQAQAHELSLPRVSMQALIGKRLLVIDDHPSFCEIVKHHGESWKMLVDTAYLAEEGLKKLEESQLSDHPVDVVILDMHLPDREGLELAHMIHGNEALKKIPLVLVTGVESLPAQDVLQELGIRLALEKPLSNMQLKETLSKLLNNEPLSQVTGLTRELDLDTMQQLSLLRVLVAEDNAVNQLVIEGLLKKFDIKPQLVSNGLEVVEEIKRNHQAFDVILMDCEMPELDGYEATRQIRTYENEQSMKKIPIVALTAHVLQEYQEKSMAAGMTEYLSKPLQLDKLKKLLLTIRL